NAGDRWCEAEAAVVVTVSVGGVVRAARLRRTTEPPYPGPSGRGHGPAGEPEGGTHLTVGARGGRCHPRGDRSRVVTHTPIRATAAMGRNTAAKAPGWEPVTSVATWVTVPPPRATKAAPPTARSSTLDRPSEIWRAAELVPASSGAESWSSSTLVEEITRPMPKQPKAQATARVQAGTDSISTLGAAAMAPATSSIPRLISRSRYGSRRGRDCTQEPSAQVPPPAARENPARVGLSPRWVTSISGTKDSAAM